MFAKNVKGKLFFPLDRKLKLRHDHWSSGVARLAVKHGLQSKSFLLAANLFSDSMGCDMSKEGLRKVTQKWGNAVDEKREKETKALFDIKKHPQTKDVEITEPIEK